MLTAEPSRPRGRLTGRTTPVCLFRLGASMGFAGGEAINAARRTTTLASFVSRSMSGVGVRLSPGDSRALSMCPRRTRFRGREPLVGVSDARGRPRLSTARKHGVIKQGGRLPPCCPGKGCRRLFRGDPWAPTVRLGVSIRPKLPRRASTESQLGSVTRSCPWQAYARRGARLLPRARRDRGVYAPERPVARVFRADEHNGPSRCTRRAHHLSRPLVMTRQSEKTCQCL